jgi:hypothetical protein
MAAVILVIRNRFVGFFNVIYIKFTLRQSKRKFSKNCPKKMKNAQFRAILNKKTLKKRVFYSKCFLTKMQEQDQLLLDLCNTTFLHANGHDGKDALHR